MRLAGPQPREGELTSVLIRFDRRACDGAARHAARSH